MGNSLRRRKAAGDDVLFPFPAQRFAFKQLFLPLVEGALTDIVLLAPDFYSLSAVSREPACSAD